MASFSPSLITLSAAPAAGSDGQACSSRLTIALGGTGEGVGAWSAAMVLLYQLAVWLRADVAEPCITLQGRHDEGPVGCTAGGGYTRFWQPPRADCPGLTHADQRQTDGSDVPNHRVPRRGHSLWLQLPR